MGWAFLLSHRNAVIDSLQSSWHWITWIWRRRGGTKTTATFWVALVVKWSWSRPLTDWEIVTVVVVAAAAHMGTDWTGKCIESSATHEEQVSLCLILVSLIQCDQWMVPPHPVQSILISICPSSCFGHHTTATWFLQWQFCRLLGEKSNFPTRGIGKKWLENLWED